MITSFLEPGNLTGTEEKSGVIDGARTRDNQNHNLGLYQLSYDHRYRRATRLPQPRIIAKTKIGSIDQICWVCLSPTFVEGEQGGLMAIPRKLVPTVAVVVKSQT